MINLNMLSNNEILLTIVIPTYNRADYVQKLLFNLKDQIFCYFEVFVIDGSPVENKETEFLINSVKNDFNFSITYFRFSGGAAVQRNFGINKCKTKFVALVDDDILLDNSYFLNVIECFNLDISENIGAICGYNSNQYLDINKSFRWKLYKKLKLFSTYDPGKYDFIVGYPINRYLRPPHDNLVKIDFCGGGNITFIRKLIDTNIDLTFFKGYSILEDVYFMLKFSEKNNLYELGTAKCLHLHAPSGRQNGFKISEMTAINFKYVFRNIKKNLTLYNLFRFYIVQLFQLISLFFKFLKHPNIENLKLMFGKILGIIKSIKY